jgi:hypothetical protein
VLPSTILGVLLAVAALGPGFLYVSVAERAQPRPQRSTLFEAVEMAVLGATSTLVALLATVAVAEATNSLDFDALARNGGREILRDPLPWLVGIAGLLAISYATIFAVAKLRYRSKASHVPAGTAWQMIFHEHRPAGEDAFVTAYLRNGAQITGRVEMSTAPLEQSRELGLRGPFGIRDTPSSPPRELRQDFLIVREAELLYLAGHYAPPSS